MITTPPLIQVSQICSIKTYLKAADRQYKWQPEKLNWRGKVKQEASFYIQYLRFYSIEEILSEEKYYIEDNIVFYKLHLEIRMSNGNLFEKYFETPEQAMEFREWLKTQEWIEK